MERKTTVRYARVGISLLEAQFGPKRLVQMQVYCGGV